MCCSDVTIFMFDQNIDKNCEQSGRVTQLTKLAPIEAHCIDCLPGPQHSVEPSSSNSNHCPPSQGLGEHLHAQHKAASETLLIVIFRQEHIFIEDNERLSLFTSYLLGDICCCWRWRETQLMEGVEAKSVNVAFFCQHHCVVFGCGYLRTVV